MPVWHPHDTPLGSFFQAGKGRRVTVIDWVTVAREALHGTRRTNAMQPIVWQCAVISVPSLYFAQGASGWFQVALVAIAVVPIANFSLAYGFFAWKDRDRLHSEDFQLRNRSLDIIESKGGVVTYDASDLSNITNPSYPQIEAPRPEEGRG